MAKTVNTSNSFKFLVIQNKPVNNKINLKKIKLKLVVCIAYQGAILTVVHVSEFIAKHSKEKFKPHRTKSSLIVPNTIKSNLLDYFVTNIILYC